MRMEIRDNKVIVDGYVNGVERLSKPIPDIRGKFVERIMSGTFQRALDRADNVPVLLNHDHDREIANTKDGSATLYEDNIGLRAIVEVTDEEVVNKAKNNQLRGWSFGFVANKSDFSTAENGMEMRSVSDLDLLEVSLLDNRKSPAYVATTVEVRDGAEAIAEYREESFFEYTNEVISKRISRYYDNGKEETESVTVEKSTSERKEVDYTDYENRIKQLKSVK